MLCGAGEGDARGRGVAQPGSALEWGSRGPAFESRHPDQKKKLSTPILQQAAETYRRRVA